MRCIRKSKRWNAEKPCSRPTVCYKRCTREKKRRGTGSTPSGTITRRRAASSSPTSSQSKKSVCPYVDHHPSLIALTNNSIITKQPHSHSVTQSHHIKYAWGMINIRADHTSVGSNLLFLMLLSPLGSNLSILMFCSRCLRADSSMAFMFLQPELVTEMLLMSPKSYELSCLPQLLFLSTLSYFYFKSMCFNFNYKNCDSLRISCLASSYFSPLTLLSYSPKTSMF